jgi:hypothetical protein
MDPVSLSCLGIPPQGSRACRCLLKGCEQWFQPTHPRCHYCSESCRKAARRWRRWRAQQKYRASPKGRELRQQQARRYRERCQNCPPPVSSASTSSASTPTACAAASALGNGAVCEGKRLREKIDGIPLCPCDRPGCYVLYAAGSAYNLRRFCSVLCRKALRCVLQREARWRQRRCRGLKRPGRRPQRRARGP